jgi:hypothetical protein
VDFGELVTPGGETDMRIMMLVVVALAFVGAPAVAQEEDAESQSQPTRNGFWFTGGLGYGSLNVSFQNVSESEGAVSTAIALGGTVSSKVQLGGLLQGWSKTTNGIDELAGGASCIVNFFPRSTSGFGLRAGVGYFVVTFDDDIDELSIGNVASLIGVGYDIPVSGSIAITPYANITYKPDSEVKLNGAGLGLDVDATLIQFGAAITIP